jgi:23S rRNA (cytosine1962-C5)-methyltransferase
MAASPSPADSPITLRAEAWGDYALMDSGHGRKLERAGPYRLVRPEPQCLWAPGLSDAEWAEADASFEASDEDEAGRWRTARPVAETWPMAWRGVRFLGRLTAFRHLGFFPEQAANWDWLDQSLRNQGPAHVLNLFGYTGISSLVCAAAGASVTHVDASKKAIGWARENAALSKLDDRPVRWICEDARRYVQREARRGSQYEGIILDPPKYGRGPAGEVWRLFEDLPELLKTAVGLLSPDASFVILNAYAERVSAFSLATLLAEAMAGRGGRIDFGELALMEAAGTRGVGLSFFARWSA